MRFGWNDKGANFFPPKRIFHITCREKSGLEPVNYWWLFCDVLEAKIYKNKKWEKFYKNKKWEKFYKNKKWENFTKIKSYVLALFLSWNCWFLLGIVNSCLGTADSCLGTVNFCLGIVNSYSELLILTRNC